MKKIILIFVLFLFGCGYETDPTKTVKNNKEATTIEILEAIDSIYQPAIIGSTIYLISKDTKLVEVRGRMMEQASTSVNVLLLLVLLIMVFVGGLGVGVSFQS